MHRCLPLVLFVACNGTPKFSGYEIVAVVGTALRAGVGDALAMKVIQKLSDGTAQDLPAGASVVWGGPPAITASSPDARDDNTIPVPGDRPTGIFVNNQLRTDRPSDLNGVLFILDIGTTETPSISVTATVSGVSPGGIVNGQVVVNGAMPVGDATRGLRAYGPNGANCANCHGPTGHGSPDNGDGTFTYDGNTYYFPAPGINDEDGNLASDPSWSAPLLAMSARADMDNGGVELRAPMPDFLTYTSSTQTSPLTATDFADIYAFLQQQSQ